MPDFDTGLVQYGIYFSIYMAGSEFPFKKHSDYKNLTLTDSGGWGFE